MAYYQSTAKKTGVAFGMMQSAAGAVISNGKWKILFFCHVPINRYLKSTINSSLAWKFFESGVLEIEHWCMNFHSSSSVRLNSLELRRSLAWSTSRSSGLAPCRNCQHKLEHE